MEFKVGCMAQMRSGESATWVKCNTETAVLACRFGRVAIGWTMARLASGKARPVRCYKWLDYGHTRSACKASFDFADRCFKCAEPGHKATECSAETWCLMCAKNYRTDCADCARGIPGNTRPLLPDAPPTSDRSTVNNIMEICSGGLPANKPYNALQ